MFSYNLEGISDRLCNLSEKGIQIAVPKVENMMPIPFLPFCLMLINTSPKPSLSPTLSLNHMVSQPFLPSQLAELLTGNIAHPSLHPPSFYPHSPCHILPSQSEDKSQFSYNLSPDCWWSLFMLYIKWNIMLLFLITLHLVIYCNKDIQNVMLALVWMYSCAKKKLSWELKE